jgi:hypothetical protein
MSNKKTLMALYDYATSVLIGADIELNDSPTMLEIVYNTQETGKISKIDYETWSKYAKNIVYTLREISIELKKNSDVGTVLHIPKELQL